MLQLLRFGKDFCRGYHSSAALLAGHSKWANIKHIKAQKDGEKAAQFTKFSRQIRLAVQEGGSTNVALNSQLRSTVEEAVRRSMPMSTIQNIIKKCEQNKAELKKYKIDLRYKQKVFAVCILYSDNFAGAKMEIAPILKKAGATFEDVGHMFDDFGIIEASLKDDAVAVAEIPFDERVLYDAIESNAEEVEVIDASKHIVNFICSPQVLSSTSKALEEKGYNIHNAEHLFVAKNPVPLTQAEIDAYNIFKKKLQDISGVEDIYDNIDFTEDC